MTIIITTGILIILGAGIIICSCCILSSKISQEERKRGKD